MGLARSAATLFVLFALVGSLPGPISAATCTFVLGFKALHDLIPAIVGDCLVNEHHNPQNGDGLQETTGPAGGTATGLLVWRKADNWTAYTDGYHTWINGPYGLQERLNTERFSWEVSPPVATPVPASAPTKPALSVPSAPLLHGLYRVALTRLDQDFYQDGNGALFGTFSCYEYSYGENAIFDADNLKIQFDASACSVTFVATQYIHSQITGDFNGFDDEAAFSLTNGQVWQQVFPTYEYHYSYRPEVFIFNANGVLTLHVLGVDTNVSVRRLV
jgi:hypothetical protein